MAASHQDSPATPSDAVASTGPDPRGVGRGAAWRAFIGRLAFAHFVGYPVLMVAAVTGMSLAIVLQEEALIAAGQTTLSSSALQHWLVEQLAMGTGDAAAFEVILRPMAVGLAAGFVLLHGLSVPWALAAYRQALEGGAEGRLRRARNWWIVGGLGPCLALVGAGVVGWLFILLRPLPH